MSEKSIRIEGPGCLIVIGLISLAVGAGYIFGAGVGWMVFGALMLALALVAIV